MDPGDNTEHGQDGPRRSGPGVTHTGLGDLGGTVPREPRAHDPKGT